MLSVFKKKGRTGTRAAVARDGGIAAVAVITNEGDRPTLRSQYFPVPEKNEDWGDSDAFDSDELGLSKAEFTRVLDPGTYQLQLVETPKVPPEEMRQALGFRVRDYIDFPLEEAVVDYLELPPHANAPNKGIAYAVIARKDEVEGEANATRDIGFHNLAAVDIPETALRNIAALLPNEDQGVAFLHFTNDIGYLTITRGGKVHLIRQIATGRQVFLENADDEFFINERAAGIALEVQRSLDYYESHYDYRPISELYLGPGAGLEVLPKALNENLGLSVLPVDLNELFTIETLIDEREQGICLIPAGAALQSAADSDELDAQSVNLIEKPHALPIGSFPIRFQLQAIAAMLVLMVGLAMFASGRVSALDDDIAIAKQQESDATERLSTLRAKLDEVIGEKSWEEQLADALTELKQRQDVLALVQGPALGETEGFARHLRAMSRQDTDGIWLTFIGLSGDGKDTRIEGRALKAEHVPMYVQNLTDELPFENQRFQQFEIDNTPDAKTQSLFFAMDSRPLEMLGGGK